jgi:non-heme Fe2+,alpha-ketoglutarate-dependent halogenase
MNRLSPHQREAYEREGTLFPLTALSLDEAARCRAAIEELAVALTGTPRSGALAQTHLFFKPIYDIVAHPAVLDIVEDVIGPDILVHSTTVFPKYAHDPSFVSWHQDGYYWNLDEPRLTSAWIALTDSDAENGCLRVVPGSHATRVEHHTRRQKDNMLTTGLEVSVEVDEAQVRDVVLRAGELSLHHVNIFHASNANPSDRERIGFAVRYVAPHVRQERDHHAVLCVRGKDVFRNFRIVEPPTADIASGVDAYTAFREEDARRRARG